MLSIWISLMTNALKKSKVKNSIHLIYCPFLNKDRIKKSQPWVSITDQYLRIYVNWGAIKLLIPCWYEKVAEHQVTSLIINIASIVYILYLKPIYYCL